MKISKKIVLGLTTVLGISMLNATSINAINAVVLPKINVTLDSQRQNRTHPVSQYSVLSETLKSKVGFSLPSFAVHDPVTLDYGTDLHVDQRQIDYCFDRDTLKPKVETVLRKVLDKIFPKVVISCDHAIISPSVYVFGLPSGCNKITVPKAEGLNSTITYRRANASYHNRFSRLDDIQKRFVVMTLHLIDNIYEDESQKLMSKHLKLSRKIESLRVLMPNSSDYEILKASIQNLRIPGGTAQAMPFTSQLVEEFRDTSDTPGVEIANCQNRLSRVMTQIDETVKKFFKSQSGITPVDDKHKDAYVRLLNEANKQAVKEFSSDKGVFAPEAELAAMQFLASCGANRSSFSAARATFASFFEEQNADSNKKRVLNTFTRSFLTLENVSKVIKETHPAEDIASMILSYEKKFTLRTLCARFGTISNSQIEDNLLQNVLDDQEVKDDINKFKTGEKELTVSELCDCTENYGSILLNLLQQIGFPLYVDVNKTFALTRYNADEAYNFLNAAVFILQMADKELLIPRNVPLCQSNGKKVTARGQQVTFVGTSGYLGVNTPAEHQNDLTDNWLVVNVGLAVLNQSFLTMYQGKRKRNFHTSGFRRDLLPRRL
ncbi:MAG: hypothetical protein LBL38_01505 [Lactobacillales bacterium]|jgi:hypothetical protein|nr:hypothetical protein [Lactobacillales bacterium]